jgi:hypothetical protein
MRVERLSDVLQHWHTGFADSDAGGSDRQLPPPLSPHVKVSMPKCPGQESHTLGVVDAKCGDDIRIQSSLLRFEAYIGAVEVEARKLFIEGEASGASEHKNDLIEGGAGDGLRKSFAEHFLQAGAVDMAVRSRVAGGAEDAENRPVAIGLGEPRDGGRQLTVPFGRQIDVLVSEDKDLTGALSNTRIVSGAGAAEAAHNL